MSPALHTLLENSTCGLYVPWVEADMHNFIPLRSLPVRRVLLKYIFNNEKLLLRKFSTNSQGSFPRNDELGENLNLRLNFLQIWEAWVHVLGQRRDELQTTWAQSIHVNLILKINVYVELLEACYIIGCFECYRPFQP